jgi:hypothetical protein
MANFADFETNFDLSAPEGIVGGIVVDSQFIRWGEVCTDIYSIYPFD